MTHLHTFLRPTSSRDIKNLVLPRSQLNTQCCGIKGLLLISLFLVIEKKRLENSDFLFGFGSPLFTYSKLLFRYKQILKSSLDNSPLKKKAYHNTTYHALGLYRILILNPDTGYPGFENPDSDIRFFQ